MHNDFDVYQMLSARTMLESTGVGIYGLGLAGESGEVVEHLKKHLGHGKALDNQKLSEELGDVLWYVAAIATRCGLHLSEITRENIRKLSIRYPDGFKMVDTNQSSDIIESGGRSA